MAEKLKPCPFCGGDVKIINAEELTINHHRSGGERGMTCKDCVYFDVCSALNPEFKKYPKDYIDSDLCAKQCTTFKDRSRFVELPCVGDKVYELCRINQFGDYKIVESEIRGFIVDTNGTAFDFELLGERFFLTHEETETIFEGRGENEK